MTKKQCPLGEDCDLTIAWMMGATEARDKAKARIEALEKEITEVNAAWEQTSIMLGRQLARASDLEAKLAKAVQAMQEAIKLADMPHYGDREDALDNYFDAIDLLRTTISELNGDKP